MAIDFRHPEYDKYLPVWQEINDISKMENVEKYLLTLNPHDTSPENRQRNEQYRARAIFNPVLQHTVEGMNSMLFSKWPELEVPAQLEYHKINCDGSGNSIYQQSQQVSLDLIRTSRAGLAVGFPRTDGTVSMADISSGNIFASIQRYDARQIINWRKTNIGYRSVLSLVVLLESYQELGSDGYSFEEKQQIKEMFIRYGKYSERLWRQNKKGEWEVFDEYSPLDGSGNYWEEIPFTFVGAENNDVSVNNPKMKGLSKLNIGLYRNSADYEDNVWFVGQTQPWMSGITQEHINMLKENNMYVGSRNLLGVPQGETFGFASAPHNPLIRQAMLDKIDQMVMLGARLLMVTASNRTATEVEGEREVQHSTLSLISSNLSEAYTKAIQWCGRYMNANTDDAYYKTTMDFKTHSMDANELRAIMEGFIQGAIPVSDFHDYLKKRDLTDKEKTLEQFQEELNVVRGIPDFEVA
ncbi:DUF4055 domain-containing protein [Nitrosomonas communis]|uniref:DUF4055 domain-containing protein n=1 Tax=Nitrosomonas communis TaxID=44574 RepID=UPI0026EDEE57|nr:DUF4055 domain-containing protein [Nitrosomonas communis]MCO6428902.1 DUF4055 domain-containing protein [Nitrosomonas communis]